MNNMKVGFIALLLSALFVSGALAQSFVVGVESIDYYPLYATQDNEYKGYGRALLDAFAKSKGYTFSYEPLPVKRLFNTFLTTDKLDFKFPDNEYWSGDAKKGKGVVYSEPAVEYIDGVSVKPENIGKGTDALKSMGLIGGFTAWDYLDAINSGAIKTDESRNYQNLLRKGFSGRVDGVYSNVAVVRYQLKQMGKEGALVFDKDLPHTRSNYHLSSIKHPEVVKEFNEFLAANAGMVEKLKQEYGVTLE